MLREACWGDPKCEWRAIPSTEQIKAEAMLAERTKHLFGDDAPRGLIDTAIEGRLYRARRNWQHGLRRAKTRDRGDDDSDERETREADQAATATFKLLRNETRSWLSRISCINPLNESAPFSMGSSLGVFMIQSFYNSAPVASISVVTGVQVDFAVKLKCG